MMYSDLYAYILLYVLKLFGVYVLFVSGSDSSNSITLLLWLTYDWCVVASERKLDLHFNSNAFSP